MQARQGARGQPEGAYMDVRNRGLPQRNDVLRRIFSVLHNDLTVIGVLLLRHYTLDFIFLQNKVGGGGNYAVKGGNALRNKTGYLL